MHDTVWFEIQGTPAVSIASSEFVDAAEAQDAPSDYCGGEMGKKERELSQSAVKKPRLDNIVSSVPSPKITLAIVSIVSRICVL